MARRIEVTDTRDFLGSVVSFEGIDVDSDETIVFAADFRASLDIMEALDDRAYVLADIEEWQILRAQT